MRRVFSTVVGGRVKASLVRRAPMEELAPPALALPGRGTAERGEVRKISLPSTKKSRFSGKNVSREVRLMTTSSDSTEPKSGVMAAVTWKFDDGRQKTSSPVSHASSPSAARSWVPAT